MSNSKAAAEQEKAAAAKAAVRSLLLIAEREIPDQQPAQVSDFLVPTGTLCPAVRKHKWHRFYNRSRCRHERERIDVLPFKKKTTRNPQKNTKQTNTHNTIQNKQTHTQKLPCPIPDNDAWGLFQTQVDQLVTSKFDDIKIYSHKKYSPCTPLSLKYCCNVALYNLYTHNKQTNNKWQPILFP